MNRLRWLALAGGLAVMAGCVKPMAPQAPVAPAVLVMPASEEPEPTPPAPADGFRFTEDRGGKILSTLLPPVDKHRVVTPSSGQRSFAPLRGLEQPDLPLPTLQAGALGLPPGAAKLPLQQRHLVEEIPLTSARATPTPPRPQSLYAGPLVRTASAPAEQPASLPYLGTPVPDRASLEDPTRDASLEAAISAALPARPGPAPFVRTPSTDPFENRDVVKLKTPPLEESVPANASPRTPK